MAKRDSFKYRYDNMFMNYLHWFPTRKAAQRAIDFWSTVGFAYKIIPTKTGGILGNKKGFKIRYRRKDEF